MLTVMAIIRCTIAVYKYSHVMWCVCVYVCVCLCSCLVKLLLNLLSILSHTCSGVVMCPDSFLDSGTVYIIYLLTYLFPYLFTSLKIGSFYVAE